MTKTIAISLSPNSEKDDVKLAMRILFSPFAWFNFRETEKLEKDFGEIFGEKYIPLAVDSGRGALYLILKIFGIGTGDEVIVQGFTCVAVPNSIIWSGAKPIYVDVDENYNINPKLIKEKITNNTKAIIVQHSFGIPANLDEIRKVIINKSIILIEDCALALGAEYKGKKIGTLGDISFFSFGRDKVISSVFGGMILCNNKSDYNKLKKEIRLLNYPSPRWVLQQLIHPILMSVILPAYSWGIGKITLGKMILFIAQQFGFLSRAVTDSEKRGNKAKIFPKKMPGALSLLARNQLVKLKRFNTNRISISNYYFKTLDSELYKLPPKIKGAIYMRFPILTDRAPQIYNCMKKKGILLGDWYKAPIVPVFNLLKVGYFQLSCRKAESYTKKIINLPTYPKMTLEDAKSVVQSIKECQNIN